MSRVLEYLLSHGSYPEETEAQKSKRRIIAAAFWLTSILLIPTVLADLEAGYTRIAVANSVIIIFVPIVLVALNKFPHQFTLLVTLAFVAGYVLGHLEPTLLGGLLSSGLSALFALIIVVGALVTIGVRAAM